MANSFIGIDEPVTIDKKVDTEQVVVGANTVERERMQIAGAADTAIAGCDAANGLDVDVTRQPARSHTTDSIRIGDGTDLALVTAGGLLQVDASGVAVPVTDNAGSLTVDGTVTVTQTTASSLNAEVQGDAAHNAALSGNPVRLGGRAQATQIAAVTDGVTTDLVTDRHGQIHVRAGHQTHAASIFTNVNFPAVNTRASSTRAAGAAGVRHVLTGLTAVLAAGATAPAAAQLDVRVRDGILDTGTILWQSVITLPATAGAMNGITRSGLWIPGTAATAMTIEFSAAGGANTFESVSMEITDITE